MWGFQGCLFRSRPYLQALSFSSLCKPDPPKVELQQSPRLLFLECFFSVVLELKIRDVVHGETLGYLKLLSCRPSIPKCSLDD